MTPYSRLTNQIRWFFLLWIRRLPKSTLFPYTTLFRSLALPAMLHRDGIADRLERFGLRRLEKAARVDNDRSEEHTSELQSHSDLVCRLLLEKKKYIRGDVVVGGE